MADKLNPKRPTQSNDTIHDRDANPDPITGAPGSHPVGTGLGAAATGAAAGAAAGLAGGPIAGAVGAAIGAVAGGYAGKGIAEQLDPTAEEAYWRDEYPHREYFREDVGFEDIKPAYRHGWEARSLNRDRSWEEVEPDLERAWERDLGAARMQWPQARPAARDAWEKVGGSPSSKR
jgi:phage tail tape-measure protein